MQGSVAATERGTRARGPTPLQERTESALERAFEEVAVGPGCPPLLAQAQRYALFPGGARIRPQLCVLASIACGDARPLVADAAASAVELMHCASLVHDDLPCFDDAAERRGKPSVHAAFGEALAILVGDAFIVASFDVLARAVVTAPRELVALLPTLATAAGTTRGIIAGQAWESEGEPAFEEYHRAKTASLFEAAAAMGAIAAGADPSPWRAFGDALGRAYQAADDVNDEAGNAHVLGKPCGQDVRLGRPTAVRTLGLHGARARVASWIEAAMASIPATDQAPLVRSWVGHFADRLGVAQSRST